MISGIELAIQENHPDSDLIRESIRQHLSGAKINHETAESPAGTIANILYGSKKQRLGVEPTSEERAHLAARINRWIKAGTPIEISTLWGALKGYGQSDERADADIMDLMGLRRYDNFQGNVSGIYNAGLKITIIREDLEEVALAKAIGREESFVSSRAPQYRESLDRICEITGLSSRVKFVDASALLSQKRISSDEYFKRCEQNVQLIFNYWIASQTTGNGQGQLPELKTLMDAGWLGPIHQDSREYYLGRVTNEHPQMKEINKIEQVCISLGIALARKQYGFFDGSYSDSKGVIPPLRTSFVPYPPGTPPELRKGRLDLKVKDAKRSNVSIPPWCGFGFMRQTEGQNTYEPTILGVRGFRELTAYEPVTVTISNGRLSQNFRADILSRQ